ARRGGRHTKRRAPVTAGAEQRRLDDRLAGQLMLALYRSGRQSDALLHYQRIRRRLADELGSDPSPPLRHLHQQLLTADPVLDRYDRPAATARSPVPRQLPASPRLFTGRTAELAALTAALEEAPNGTG